MKIGIWFGIIAALMMAPLALALDSGLLIEPVLYEITGSLTVNVIDADGNSLDSRIMLSMLNPSGKYLVEAFLESGEALSGLDKGSYMIEAFSVGYERHSEVFDFEGGKKVMNVVMGIEETEPQPTEDVEAPVVAEAPKAGGEIVRIGVNVRKADQGYVIESENIEVNVPYNGVELDGERVIVQVVDPLTDEVRRKEVINPMELMESISETRVGGIVKDIDLKEGSDGLVYTVNVEEKGNILGIIPTVWKKVIRIDSQSGKIIDSSEPFWTVVASK